MVTISHRIASLLVGGCLIATASGVALADDHPAYISKQDVSGMYQAGAEHEDHMAGYEDNEFIYLIKGSIKLTSADGTVIVVGPGEAATIPKGWKGHWDTGGYTKLWVTYDPDAKPNAK